MLVFAILTNTSASFLLKKSSLAASSTIFRLGPLEVTWYLLFSAGLFGLAFFSYAISLRELPLHVAHPLSTAIPIAIVACLAWAFLGEQFSLIAIAGIILILVGVTMVGLG